MDATFSNTDPIEIRFSKLRGMNSLASSAAIRARIREESLVGGVGATTIQPSHDNNRDRKDLESNQASEADEDNTKRDAFCNVCIVL